LAEKTSGNLIQQFVNTSNTEGMNSFFLEVIKY